MALDTAKVKTFNALQPSGFTGIAQVPRVVSDVGANFLGYTLHNNDSSARWVQVYFKPAANVTPGTTAADVTVLLGASASVSLIYEHPISVRGLSLSASTTEIGTTAPTAAVTGQIFYKD